LHGWFIRLLEQFIHSHERLNDLHERFIHLQARLNGLHEQFIGLQARAIFCTRA
jgi:uncharacterized coiled-coil DUF342 family protein